MKFVFYESEPGTIWAALESEQTGITFSTFLEKVEDEKNHTRYAFAVGFIYNKTFPVSFIDNTYSVPNGWSEKRILTNLLSFLCLKPGDTDPEYFLSYNPVQLAWANSQACEFVAAEIQECEENLWKKST